MLEAEIKGKIPEIQAMEDILTSTVFGLLKYIVDKGVLLKILENAKTLSNKSFQDSINVNLIDYTTEILFWQRIPGYGEPDLIIRFKNNKKPELILCIEVKYYSSKSGEGDDDQLRRYFEGLDFTSSIKNSIFLGVIYLTKYPSKDELESSLFYMKKHNIADSENKLFQLRWYEVTKAIEEYDIKSLDERDRKILFDLLKYLHHKNLVEFTHFTFLSQDFYDNPPLFYHYEKKGFNGFSFLQEDFNLKFNNKMFYG